MEEAGVNSVAESLIDEYHSKYTRQLRSHWPYRGHVAVLKIVLSRIFQKIPYICQNSERTMDKRRQAF